MARVGTLQESSECHEDHWTWTTRWIFVQEPDLSLTIHWRANRHWQLPAGLPSHTFWRRMDCHRWPCSYGLGKCTLISSGCPEDNFACHEVHTEQEAEQSQWALKINTSISNPQPITRFLEISKWVWFHLGKAALHNKKLLTSWHSPFSASVGKVVFSNSFILCNLWWMSSKNFKQMGETFQKDNEGSLRYFCPMCSSFIRAQIYKVNKLSLNSHCNTWGIKTGKERVNTVSVHTL